MCARRTGKVWGGKGVGWLSKKEEEDAKYDNLGDGWPYFIAICRWYPDFFCDILQAEDAPFTPTLIQRVFDRVLARYKNVAITASRGAGKSYDINKENNAEMVLWPGITGVIFGPSGKQSASIARQIHKQLEANYPILMQMLTVERDSAMGSFETTTMFGSRTNVDAFRGNTVHKAIAEETAQEDRGAAFQEDKFRESVAPQIRARYSIGRKTARSFVSHKLHSITSAGRRQQYAYQLRMDFLRLLRNGESAYVLDIGYQAILLCGMRTVEWAEDQKHRVGISGWPREMESIYSGNEKNPLIPEELIDSARCLALTENHHCCMDHGCKLRPDEVIYVVGYDVSYRDNKKNAKCAAVVLKLTRQNDRLRKDRYLKQVVWIEDWYPGETPTPEQQAARLKRIWSRFCFEGSQTYIAIDAWQVGNDVLLALMKDLDDGMKPLCTWNHMEYMDLELEGAIPCVYPVRAGGVGVRDPDSAMIGYIQTQFLYGNIQLLTSSMSEGVEAYKKAHRIRDDAMNNKISQPYKRTSDLVEQIANLREEPSGRNGVSERRINRHIQRDSWSALKYACWFASILEGVNLRRKQSSGWTKVFQQGAGKFLARAGAPKSGRLVAPRSVGRMK